MISTTEAMTNTTQTSSNQTRLSIDSSNGTAPHEPKHDTMRPFASCSPLISFYYPCHVAFECLYKRRVEMIDQSLGRNYVSYCHTFSTWYKSTTSYDRVLIGSRKCRAWCSAACQGFCSLNAYLVVGHGTNCDDGQTRACHQL